jgi:hypothetical protein
MSFRVLKVQHDERSRNGTLVQLVSLTKRDSAGISEHTRNETQTRLQ